MIFPYFVVDAFASRVFSGNPAGVCLLDHWLPAPLLQAVAAENNLSETAFLVPTAGPWELRWFTPSLEVDLCGHATLAAAHVLIEQGEKRRVLEFATQSGLLSVRSEGGLLTLDFPSRPPQPAEPPGGLREALGGHPRAVLQARDHFVVYGTEEEIRRLQPDFPALRAIRPWGTIVTAPGDTCDFVSRFFAPGAGIPEDPVTGSSHCSLIPYWAQRLKKSVLQARQLSARGGELFCEDAGDRVRIGGRARTYSAGTIFLANP
jgi:PhzF family phenazine biosynthesis protein